MRRPRRTETGWVGYARYSRAPPIGDYVPQLNARQLLAQHAPAPVKSAAAAASALRTRSHRKRLSQNRWFAIPQRRVYFFHIRKCAGTSLISGLLSSTGADGSAAYARLGGSTQGWIELDGRIIVGWHRHLINEGFYQFGFSHRPAHELNLPANTFTVTVLRDPVARVISHYRMLRYFQAHTPNDYAYQMEGPWLGNGLADFLGNLPREHLLRQLYMFSPTFDVAEAAERIKSIDHVMHVERFADGIGTLGARLGVEIRQVHEKRYDFDLEITDAERRQLTELLAPEYELLAKVS
jgi:hypothetical protein